jgi:hypothetical protein
VSLSSSSRGNLDIGNLDIGKPDIGKLGKRSSSETVRNGKF